MKLAIRTLRLFFVDSSLLIFFYNIPRVLSLMIKLFLLVAVTCEMYNDFFGGKKPVFLIRWGCVCHCNFESFCNFEVLGR